MVKEEIYQNRNNGQAYSIVQFERLIDLERELEEVFAIHNDLVEMYEKKWEKINNKTVNRMANGLFGLHTITNIQLRYKKSYLAA